MAQTRRRRRRKHRGTQSGRIDRGRARGRPRTREEARAQARRRVSQRREHDPAPTWGGAFVRGLFGAALFFVIATTLLDRTVVEGISLSIVMLALYVPLGYYIDRFFWRRRQAKHRGGG